MSVQTFAKMSTGILNQKDDHYEDSIYYLPAIQVLLIILVSLYMLRGYADRQNTSYFIQFTVLIGWFLSFSVIVFIPLDIYLEEKKKEYPDSYKQDDQEEKILYNYWKISYWSSYFLNWIIIPLLQGFVIAGEFSTYDKIYRSIMFNVPFFLLYFLSFISLLGLIFYIDNSDGENGSNILNEQGIFAVAIALSLAFGFLNLVCLLGYGLVLYPLSFWNESNIQEKLNRLLFKVSVYEEQIQLQQVRVQAVVNIVNQIEVAEDIEPFKKEMIQDIDQFTINMQEYNFSMRSGSFLDTDNKLVEQFLNDSEPCNYSKLVSLNLKLKNQMTILRRLYSFRAKVIKSSIIDQDIIKSRITDEGEFHVAQQIQSSFFKQRSPDSLVDRQVLKFQTWWYLRDYRSVFYRIAAFTTALLSILIIYIEVMFFFKGFEETGLHQFLTDQFHRSYWSQDFVYLIPFGYIIYATNYGLFQFDAIDFLALHWKQNTDPYCLMYSCINTWRLGIAIAYNFLQIMSIKSCSFLDVMGPVQSIPLVGQDVVDSVFPICLCLTVIFTASNSYFQFSRIFGNKKVYIKNNSKTLERIAEGIFIVKQHRSERGLITHKQSKVDNLLQADESTDSSPRIQN